MNESFIGEQFFNLEESESVKNEVVGNSNGFNGYMFIGGDENLVRHTHSENGVSDIFFSGENIDNIQEQIINIVYKKSGGKWKIGRQSDTQLKIIMKSIYLQHSKNLPCNLNNQVIQLNNKVIEYSVGAIHNEILQYIGYLKDIDSPRKLMNRPKNISSAGTKTLELKPFF